MSDIEFIELFEKLAEDWETNNSKDDWFDRIQDACESERLECAKQLREVIASIVQRIG